MANKVSIPVQVKPNQKDSNCWLCCICWLVSM